MIRGSTTNSCVWKYYTIWERQQLNTLHFGDGMITHIVQKPFSSGYCIDEDKKKKDKHAFQL